MFTARLVTKKKWDRQTDRQTNIAYNNVDTPKFKYY